MDSTGTEARQAPQTGATDGQHMRADARRNRERLLVAAQAAFSAHGTDAPLDDIARRAGVGIGTLYRHFPTRLALQEAVFRDQVETMCALGDDLVDGTAAGDALVTWLHALVGYVATKRGLSQTLINSLHKDSGFLSSCSSRIRETGAQLLDAAKRAGVVRSDVGPNDLMRLCHAIVLATEQAGEPEGSAERLVSLVLDGLRTGDRAQSHS